MLVELFSLVAIGSAHADGADNYKNYPECRAVQKLSAPGNDRPTDEQIASLKGCNAKKPYYGIGEPVDFKKARLCSFARRQNDDEEFWGGSTILYMIYANGQGVTRDTKVALNFACDLGGATAEIEARKEEFKKLPFAGEAYEKLKIAAADFTKARSENEVDLSGSARAAFQLQEEAIQERDFLQSLQMFAADKVPHFDRRKEDIKMNDVFKKILATKKKDFYGTVTKSQILTTQKAWVKYRNAWKVFAGTPAKADLIDAWFTKKRTHMLESMSTEL